MSVKQQAERFIEANLCLSLLGQIPGSHAHDGLHSPSRTLVLFQFIITAGLVRSLIA
jgi:hypothetical protein